MYDALTVKITGILDAVCPMVAKVPKKGDLNYLSDGTLQLMKERNRDYRRGISDRYIRLKLESELLKEKDPRSFQEKNLRDMFYKKPARWHKCMKEVTECRSSDQKDTIDTAKEIRDISDANIKREIMADFYAKISNQHPPPPFFCGGDAWSVTAAEVAEVIKGEKKKSGTHSTDAPFEIVKAAGGHFGKLWAPIFN